MSQLPLERSTASNSTPTSQTSPTRRPARQVTTAELFLDELVAGIPWAHIGIAGTMSTDVDDAWRSAGATGFGARLASPSTSPPGRTWGRFLIRSNVPPERTWGRFLVRSRVKASAFKIDLCTLVGPNQEPSPGSVLGGADGLATARVNRFSAMSPLAAGGWLGF